MKSWRDKLSAIVKGPSGPQSNLADLDQARSEVEQFLRETVVPAFEDIRGQLRELGRDARIELQPMVVVLRVLRDGQEEFTYAVRGSAYHRMSFAYPVIGEDDNIQVARAEILHPSGVSDEFRLKEFSHQGLIDDFVDAYAHWMGTDE